MSASKQQQPILAKSIPDSWTADTVTSTFVLEPLAPPVALRTDSCGFGWHFEIAVNRELSNTPSDWEASFVTSFCFTPPTGHASGVLRTGLRVGCTAAMMFNPTYTRTVALGFCSPSMRSGNSVHDRIGTCTARLEGVQRVTFTFFVSFPDGSTPFRAPQSHTALTERAKEALTRTIESGEFVDVKFYLFSAVTRDGTVCRPKPIYGSRTVLHQVCEYLDNLVLGDGFSESQIVDLDGEWDVATSGGNEYDYDEDSDLEELEEGGSEVEQTEQTSSANDPVDVQEFTQPQRAVARRMGRICQPKNIAYKTFKGLLTYLYTQDITLAPLKSTQNAGKGKGTASDLSSPKSMYRLAHMIDLPALKQICLDALRQRLTDDNIYSELFSKFTWQHPEILEVELDFSLDHWRQSETQRSLSIARCLSGEYPHAALAMNRLLARLGPSGEVERKSYSCAPSPHWSPPRGDLGPMPEPWYPTSSRAATPQPESDIVAKACSPEPVMKKEEEYTVGSSSLMSYGKPGKSKYGKKK